jgi:hypothetical protein
MGDQRKRSNGLMGEWLKYLLVASFLRLGVMDSWNKYLFEYNVAPEVEKLIASPAVI